MLINHFKTASRNLVKRKFTTLINLVGMSISLAVFILTGLYIHYETSFDSFHQKSEQIYLLTKELDTESGINLTGKVNYAEGPLLDQDFPQINNVVRLYKSDNSLSRSGDQVFMENDFFFVDDNIMNVFDFELISGSAEALKSPDNIFITQETAQRYFGDEEPLGRVISVTEQYWNVTNDFVVAGVLRDLPSNSHIQFDFLAPMMAFERLTGFQQGQSPVWLWGWNAFMVYLELNENVDAKSFEISLDEFREKHYPERIRDISDLELTPLGDVYLRTDIANGFGIAGSPRSIKVLSGIALFILIIACINFINLTTAKSSIYAKEIGVKKVLGARRTQLFAQFIIESVFLTFVSVVVAIVLVEVSMPMFEYIVGKELEVNLFTSTLILQLGAFTVVIGILAGLYPAVALSGFKTLLALKGESGQAHKKVSLRKVLVVFQFAMSVLLVLGSMVVYKQLIFVTERDLGFSQEQVLYMEMPSGVTTANLTKYDQMQDRLRNLPEVLQVTSTEQRPGVFVADSFVVPQGKSEEEKLVMPMMYVDEHFFETFNLELAEGEVGQYVQGAPIRYFVNKEAIEVFGWDNDIIGKSIDKPTTTGTNYAGLVQGILPEFNFESLYNEIGPLVVGIFPNTLASGRWNIYLKVNTSDYDGLTEEVKVIFDEFYPDRPFNINFLEETISQQYASQRNLLKILPILTGFALFIACLGLFGLAAFLVERKTKEVGIRKVLGASASQIVSLFSKEFVWLIVLANIVAWPLGFFFLSDWLSNFSYRIDLGASLFIISGLSVVVLALLTIGFKVFKGAQGNPVNCLRHE